MSCNDAVGNACEKFSERSVGLENVSISNTSYIFTNIYTFHYCWLKTLRFVLRDQTNLHAHTSKTVFHKEKSCR